MATYCTRTRLTNNLPSSLPSSMDNDFLDEQIEDASDEVDELVGHLYTRAYKTNTQKFPDISDSPATPKTVENCALWLALSHCYEVLEIENEGDAGETTPRKEYYRAKASKLLNRIAMGEIDLNITAVAQVETQDRYLDSTDEDDKDWVIKKSELDRLYP